MCCFFAAINLGAEPTDPNWGALNRRSSPDQVGKAFENLPSGLPDSADNYSKVEQDKFEKSAERLYDVISQRW